MPYIEVASNSNVTNKITLVSSTSNLLPNEAVTQTIGGLTITVRPNKSIAITGQATDSGAITIAGTISNTTPLLVLKANTSYYLSELPLGMIWNLYYYNGTEKELVYSGSGGVINLTQDKLITQADITWATADILTTEDDEPLLTEAGDEISTEGGEVTSEAIIYPMLNVGDTAKEYEVHKNNKTEITLGSNEFTSNIKIENGTCYLDTTFLNIDRVINTYNPNTVIYAMEDVSLNIKYFKCDLYERIEKTAENNGYYYSFGAITLYDTYASEGAIQKIRLTKLTPDDFLLDNGIMFSFTNGEKSSSSKYESQMYHIYFSDVLRTYNNISDELIIENGKAYAIRKIGVNANGDMYILDNETREDATKILAGVDNTSLVEVNGAYFKTWDNITELRVLPLGGKTEPQKIYIEYMLKNTFTDIFCTKTEKDASIKVVEDMIALEVERASIAEGELSSSITLEADRITEEVTRATTAEEELSSSITIEADRISQIVSAVGNDDEEVTPASIVASINDSKSSIKISADHIDIEGTVFPTIGNSSGTCEIDTLFEGTYGNGIEYTSETMHVFNGSMIVNPTLPLYGVQINNTEGAETARFNDTRINLGTSDMSVNLYGTIKINGVDIDTYIQNKIDEALS